MSFSEKAFLPLCASRKCGVVLWIAGGCIADVSNKLSTQTVFNIILRVDTAVSSLIDFCLYIYSSCILNAQMILMMMVVMILSASYYMCQDDEKFYYLKKILGVGCGWFVFLLFFPRMHARLTQLNVFKLESFFFVRIWKFSENFNPHNSMVFTHPKQQFPSSTFSSSQLYSRCAGRSIHSCTKAFVEFVLI